MTILDKFLMFLSFRDFLISRKKFNYSVNKHCYEY